MMKNMLLLYYTKRQIKKSKQKSANLTLPLLYFENCDGIGYFGTSCCAYTLLILEAHPHCFGAKFGERFRARLSSSIAASLPVAAQSKSPAHSSAYSNHGDILDEIFTKGNVPHSLVRRVPKIVYRNDDSDDADNANGNSERIVDVVPFRHDATHTLCIP